MNNKKINSLGKILVKYRKMLNFTQKDIAKKLCLKLELIDNIEKDIFPTNIPKVFYCGYIYSYARLVKVSKKKIFLFLERYNNKNYCFSESKIKKDFDSFFFLNYIYFFLIKLIVLFFSFYFFWRYLKN